VWNGILCGEDFTCLGRENVSDEVVSGMEFSEERVALAFKEKR